MFFFFIWSNFVFLLQKTIRDDGELRNVSKFVVWRKTVYCPSFLFSFLFLFLFSWKSDEVDLIKLSFARMDVPSPAPKHICQTSFCFQKDRTIGSVQQSICLSICLSVCLFFTTSSLVGKTLFCRFWCIGSV